MSKLNVLELDERWKRDVMVAAGCGVGIALITTVTQFLIGTVAGTEARSRRFNQWTNRNTRKASD